MLLFIKITKVRRKHRGEDMDRRVKKSRTAIESALMELMTTKTFEEITINAIAETADVSRGTIYLNYDDKYAILESCMDKELNQLIESCIPNKDHHENLTVQALLLSAFKYIETNSTIYITLLENSAVKTFREKLLRLVKDRILGQLKLTTANESLNSEISTQFWSVAIIGIIEWWIKESMPYSSEEITEYLFDVLSRNEIIPLSND